MGAECGKQLEEPRIHDVAPAMKGALQAGLHEAELLAVLAHEGREAAGVARGEGRDLPLHLCGIRSAIDLPACSEEKAILRVEPTISTSLARVVPATRMISSRTRG